MTFKAIIYIFLLLLIIPVAIADLNYTESGEADNFYIRGTGAFNSALDPNDITISTKVLSDPEQIPLIADVDGDGITEIFIISDENIIAIQNKTLTTSGTFGLNATADDHFSNMILFDIDDDGTLEIIIASEEDEVLHIINYSNSVFTAEATIGFDGLTFHQGTGNDAGKITIGCESANRCLMYYGLDNTADATVHVSASFFNSTFVGLEEVLFTQSDGERVFCPPKIRHIATANYDSAVDDDIEFIFSGIIPQVVDGDDGEDYFVWWVNILSNNSVILEGTQSITGVRTSEIFSNSGGGFSCDNFDGQNAFRSSGSFGDDAIAGNFVTAPLVFDADPDEAGLETIFGVAINNADFIMRMYKPDRTTKRSFPFVATADGQIMSNIFRAEVFDDSNTEQDFCMVGHDATASKLSLLCGSLQDTDGVGVFNTQTIEFTSDTLNIANITDDYSHWGMIAHAVEYDDSNSVSEIVTTWGILEPVFSGIACSFSVDSVDCNLDLLFKHSKQDGSVIPVDYDEVNLEDLLILTTTNLFYIDDGFQNNPINVFCGEPNSVTGTCTEWSINPCIDSVWKANTTAEIKITGIDPESDLVQVSATLYEGDVNERTQTSANVSSGTEVPFSFDANKTIGAGVIKMTAVDIVENPSVIRTLSKSFSVAPNGVELGDCITTISEGVEAVAGAEVADATLTADATDNAITNGLGTFQGITGLAGTTVWLLLMMLGAFFIYSTMAERGLSGSSALGVIAIVEVLAIIIGARIGVFSTGLVVTITVIGVVIIGIFLGKTFRGDSTAE